jgi:outer membrane immunogenic protein
MSPAPFSLCVKRPFEHQEIRAKMAGENDWLRLTSDDQRASQRVRWSVAMRRLVLAAAMIGMAFGAQAADMPDLPILRGSVAPALSSTSRNWDGWYVGGQLGYSSAEMDFSHSVKSLTNFMLRNSVLQAPIEQWALLSKNHSQSFGFGAFVGRNWQWEDLVFGFEANYNYFSNLQASATNSMTRLIVNPAGENPPAGHTHTYVTTLSGNAGLQIKDVVTLRSRAGWAVGNALPYVFGGLAVGRVDVSRAATVSYDKYDDFDTITPTLVGFDPLGNPIFINVTSHSTVYLGSNSQSSQERRSNSFVPGWTAGLGMEYMLWGNVFMRGEWEYIRFLNVKDISFSANNVRLGIGYKF